MEDELEGTKAQVEGAEPTQEEGVKPTEPKVEPTIEKTFKTEADFQAAVSKGIESTTRQLSLSQAEAKKVKAEAEQHKIEITQRDTYIESLKKEVEEALEDDPDKRRAYISKIASLEREQKIAKREAEAENKLYQAELRVWQAGMGLKAQALVMEFPSLNLNVKELIETSATEEEMENKVLRLSSKKEPEAKEPEKTPKFDPGTSSGGVDFSNLSPKEKIQMGLEKLKKK